MERNLVWRLIFFSQSDNNNKINVCQNFWTFSYFSLEKCTNKSEFFSAFIVSSPHKQWHLVNFNYVVLLINTFIIVEDLCNQCGVYSFISHVKQNAVVDIINTKQNCWIWFTQMQGWMAAFQHYRLTLWNYHGQMSCFTQRQLLILVLHFSQSNGYLFVTCSTWITDTLKRCFVLLVYPKPPSLCIV